MYYGVFMYTTEIARRLEELENNITEMIEELETKRAAVLSELETAVKKQLDNDASSNDLATTSSGTTINSAKSSIKAMETRVANKLTSSTAEVTNSLNTLKTNTDSKLAELKSKIKELVPE